jgi:hypothetical protein
MDLFFSVVISGMAVGYITELAIKLFDGLIPTWITRIFTTVPTAMLMHNLLGTTGLELVPLGLASGFFALVMMSVINRVSSTRR